MNKEQSKNISLRTKPQSSVRINKPLVFIFVAVLFFVLIWIIISAFSTEKAADKNFAKMSAQDLKPVVSDVLTQLPSAYTDTDTIKKYLTKPQQTLGIPPIVKQELETLRNQQAFLQQKLNDLSQHPRSQIQPQNDAQLMQAKTSGLFFPGGAPKQEAYTKNSESKTSSSSESSSGGIGSKQDEYTKQNMQAQKMQFLKSSDKPDQIYNPHRLVKPISPYEIQAGALIPAVLITGINTTLPGQVVAQVRQNIYNTVSGQFLLIPKGSKLLGEYDSQVSYGQARVLIVFTRIIRPDGSSIQINKSGGTDLLGNAGMKGDVNNHWARVLGAATLSTLLSVGAGAAADNNYNNTGTMYRSSGQNALLGGAGGIAQSGQELTSRAMNIQPTLSLAPGYEFNVIVKKDLIMKPFKSMKASGFKGAPSF